MDVQNMKIEEVIKEINRLHKKNTEEGLTPNELEFRDKLRRRYIDNVKRNFKVQLEGIELKNK